MVVGDVCGAQGRVQVKGKISDKKKKGRVVEDDKV